MWGFQWLEVDGGVEYKSKNCQIFIQGFHCVGKNIKE
jgi:hypothetical protein